MDDILFGKFLGMLLMRYAHHDVIDAGYKFRRLKPVA